MTRPKGIVELTEGEFAKDMRQLHKDAGVPILHNGSGMVNALVFKQRIPFAFRIHFNV